MQRDNTGFRDGYYALPSGHVDGGEPAVREAKEWVGVDIDSKGLRLVHKMHRYSEHPEPHEKRFRVCGD